MERGERGERGGAGGAEQPQRSEVEGDGLDLLDDLEHGGHPGVVHTPPDGPGHQLPQHAQLLPGGRWPGEPRPGGGHGHAEDDLGGGEREGGDLDGQLGEERDAQQLQGRPGGDEVEGGDLGVGHHHHVPHVALPHQLEQELLHEGDGGPGHHGGLLADGGQQDLAVHRVQQLHQLPVLLGLLQPAGGEALLLPPLLPVLVHQPQSAQPLLVGHHEVRHHAGLHTGQVAAPLTAAPGLRRHGAVLRPELAGVAPPHVPLDGSPPEALAALAALDPVVDPGGLVAAHRADTACLVFLHFHGIILKLQALLKL